MKKLLSSLLAVGLLATGVVAYATPNVTGPDNSGDIDIEIHLGFNPNDEGPTPPNPDLWLSVEIPTRILIFSDAEDAHETFVEVNHTIRNFSARGVRVDVAAFKPDSTHAEAKAFEPIELLTINGTANNSHDLIKEGEFTTPQAITPTTGWELMTLPASQSGAAHFTSETFSFTGTIDIGALGTTTSQADAELTLRLRPIL